MHSLTDVIGRVGSYKEEVIALQRELTSRPAIGPESGGEGEYNKAQYIKEMLDRLYPDETFEVNAPDERVPAGFRPNFLAVFNGENRERTLWILSHMDVVPPGDLGLWKTDPFKIHVEDGRIIGRGVEDNQQAIVASYLAIKALREVGVTPKINLGLVFVADEETGSSRGLQYVLEKKGEKFGQKDLIIIPDGGNSDGTMVEVAEKSMLWLKFHTIGKQSHASRPDLGINSFKAASHFITRLEGLYEKFSVKDELYNLPISTFEPTKKEANIPNVNTIPSEDVFYLDCRILPNYSLDEVMAQISRSVKEVENEFKVTITVTPIQSLEAPAPTPVDAPVVKALSKSVAQVKGLECKVMGVGGGTVAAFFRKAGLYAAVWSTVDETAHQPNEYCLINNILDDCKVFLHLLFSDVV